MVSGTKMISDTSLVTNMEQKKTPKIRNRDREVIRFRLEASPTRGRRTFSCLNPSRTHSIIRSVPRVCQSISRISCAEGGVMISAIPAARRDSVSISSFFRKLRILFITFIPFRFAPRGNRTILAKNRSAVNEKAQTDK